MRVGAGWMRIIRWQVLCQIPVEELDHQCIVQGSSSVSSQREGGPGSSLLCLTRVLNSDASFSSV